MTRGPRPEQALREAKIIAARQGNLCENQAGRGILYDFAIHLALAIVYVRVKRLRREIRIFSDIEAACADDLRRLRAIPVTAGLVRELWVRSSKGTWQFFIVLENEIVRIPHESMPEYAFARPIRENSPGPDQAEAGARFPIRREEFVCPFTVPPLPGNRWGPSDLSGG